MAKRHADEAMQQSGRAMKRRGILAAAGVALAGIAAKRASGTVGAAQVAVIMENTASGAPLNSPGATVLFIARSDFNTGAGAAVIETNTSKQGMRGIDGNDGYNGIGVRGKSTAGIGVQGTSTTGTGVVGSGPNGVFGTTASVGGYGGFFTTTTFQATAVGGQVFGDVSGSAAFVGAAGPGNYAAFFTGQVSINGSLFVSGGAKSAAVKHPRTNDYRALYCEESPDSWFADYGRGKLVNGQAEVKLDPDFAALIHTDDYLVFLTPEGDTKGLYVASKAAGGFAVREVQGGASSLAFAYRIVGKRSDIKLERLAKVTMPNIKLASEPPKVPDAPATPPDPPPPPTVPPSRPAAPAGGVQGSGGTQSNPTNPVQPIPPPRP